MFVSRGDAYMEPTSLDVVKLRIAINYQSSGAISRNLANTFRGGFGAALRNVVCHLKQDTCADCLLKNACAYGYIFETPIPAHARVMRKYTHAPHPLIIIPPKNNRRTVKQGQQETIELRLIGSAAAYLPYVILALDRLGETGLGFSSVNFSVEEIIDETGELIYRKSEHTIRKDPPATNLIIQPGDEAKGIFSIHFTTPTRLKIDGSTNRMPTFFDVVSSLCRRTMLLSYFHCGGSGEPFHGAFLDKTGDIELIESNVIRIDNKRFSSRQKREIPMDGFMGSLTIRGDYGFFLPLLKAGEIVHIGKNTIFGFGQIHVTIEEES
jgi:CRISPR-associated endoribonuclease Cas6